MSIPLNLADKSQKDSSAISHLLGLCLCFECRRFDTPDVILGNRNSKRGLEAGFEPMSSRAARRRDKRELIRTKGMRNSFGVRVFW